MIKHDPNKITATMRLVVTGEFYDDEASEETLRYCIEQDLEDEGFEVDVSLLKEQEEQIKNRDESLEKAREEIEWLRGMLKEREAKIEQLNRFVNGFSRDAMPVVRCKDCKYWSAERIND